MHPSAKAIACLVGSCHPFDLVPHGTAAKEGILHICVVLRGDQWDESDCDPLWHLLLLPNRPSLKDWTRLAN